MKQVLFISVCIAYFCADAGAQWTPIGPKGGFFKNFAFHPSDPNIIFAGSDDSGGIWKSEDSGATWRLVSEEFPDMTGWHINVDKNNPNVVFACDFYGRYGILKSTDGGESWTRIVNGLSTRYDLMVTKLVIASANADTLYISTGESLTGDPARPGNGIFKSVDGGTSWTASGLQGTPSLCLCRTAVGKLFAGTSGFGLRYSSDGGANWNLVTGIPATAVINQVECVDSVIAVSAGERGIYLSADSGNSFQYIGEAGELNLEVFLAQTSPTIEVYSTSTTGLRKYTSPPGAWRTFNSPLFNNQLVIEVAVNNKDIYCGTFDNSPIIQSTDAGNSWSYVKDSPDATFIAGIAVDPCNQNRIFAAMLGTYFDNFNREGLFETTDAGANWTRKGPLAHALVVKFSPSNSNTMYLGTFLQGLYKSTDGFATWNNIRPGQKIILDIAIDTNNPAELFISEWDIGSSTMGIYKSVDGGSHFSQIYVEPASSIVLVPGTDSVIVATGTGVYRSPDKGNSWSLWALSGYEVYDVTYSNGKLYAGTSAGEVFVIDNTSVHNISGPWHTLSQVKNLYIKNGILYAGLNTAEQDTLYYRSGGMWYTADEGQSWTDISAGMTTTHVYGNTCIAESNGKILAGTYGRGILKLDSPVSSVSHISTDPPPFFQSYPNPFNLETTIEYSLAQTGKVTLVIYNLLGKRVRTLVNKRQEQGNHSVVWDGKDESGTEVSSGAYFYTLRTEAGVLAGNRMILLK